MPGNYSKKIERNISQSAVLKDNSVKIYGAVPYEEIPSLLKKAHLFVSASTLEVQSTAIIEALASGTPVVGLSNQTVDELIDKSCGFRLDKKTTPETFAEKIREFRNISSPKYNNLAGKSRERVMHFSWESISQKTVKR
jgi:glycosyltransferase involved in cell wall biosynthesis